jgi:hypothetical protein
MIFLFHKAFLVITELWVRADVAHEAEVGSQQIIQHVTKVSPEKHLLERQRPKQGVTARLQAACS